MILAMRLFCKAVGMDGRTGRPFGGYQQFGKFTNIVNGIKAMRSIGGDVITLTGFCEDNVSRSLGDFNVHVPVKHYGMVESIHNLLLQQIVDAMGEES